MASRLLARRLVRTGCACVTLAVAVAGCTSSSSSSSSSTSVTGNTLAIYVSAPAGTLSPEERDVLAAETLAFNQSGGRVGKFTLRLVPSRRPQLSDNARQAIGDTRTIAYVGELVPGSSADTLGITNAEDVLQVSPTDTAVELTQSTPAIPNTPNRYYEALSTYGRTFARVVPTSALEAEAVVAEMKSLGVRTVYVPTDGSEYGRALREAFASRAASAGLTVASSDASVDAVFYAGSSAAGATQVFTGAASSNPKAALFAPSALDLNSFATSLPAAAEKNLYVSAPGFTPGDLPPAGQQFESAFKASYGHAPLGQAIFGYAAMSAVIHALQQAGSSATDRSTVVHDFLHITNLSTAVGTISINKNGDVEFAGGAPFAFSRVKAGRLVPVKAAHE
jgi:branched-chain amino acid transport system substrate-binding protein